MSVLAKNGTLAQVNAAAAASQLVLGELIYITDTGQGAIATDVNSYKIYAHLEGDKLSEDLLNKAAAADFRGAVAGKLLTTDTVWSAAVPTTGPDLTGTIAVSFSEALNRRNKLTGNIVLGQVTNAKPGQILVWELAQDATGGRTLAYNTQYWATPKGQGIELSLAANAVDIVQGYVLSSGVVLISLAAQEIG